MPAHANGICRIKNSCEVVSRQAYFDMYLGRSKKDSCGGGIGLVAPLTNAGGLFSTLVVVVVVSNVQKVVAGAVNPCVAKARALTYLLL